MSWILIGLSSVSEQLTRFFLLFRLMPQNGHFLSLTDHFIVLFLTVVFIAGVYHPKHCRHFNRRILATLYYLRLTLASMAVVSRTSELFGQFAPLLPGQHPVFC